MSLLDITLEYLRTGLCVLPAILVEKRPSLREWKQYQHRRPTEAQLQNWFGNATTAVCVVTGAISGHLEMIDFDYEGELFEPWRELVESEEIGLVGRLVIEQTQSGGRHVIYRCESAVVGNQKLAQRTVAAPDGNPVTIAGKQHAPRPVGDRFEITCTLIETRGEGGLFLCDPTPSYRLEQGSLNEIPVLSEHERSLLIEAALALNETLPPSDQVPSTSFGERPGDDFNARGDVRKILRKHGWTLVRSGVNEYWRRPGKTAGWSATLKDNVFYVFSSNSMPFEPDRGYAPFSVYTLLEHAGDFAAAAAALRNEGYGPPADNGDVDLSKFACGGNRRSITESPPDYPNPGPMPSSYFRVPGFVSEVMDHCLATAPYPNVALAFCGALSLQALLAGRKVRDEGDNRTNLYLLALAFSSVGKDWPRKLNTNILHRVGMIDSLGEKFASGEGIQDSLFLSPAMLFQTDEIDGLLQSINKSREARHENLLGTLLTLFSAANTVYPMRRKAGKEPAGVVDQPCLVVFGTAIPPHYYEALSERMLTNGFFARMIIVESGPRSTGQDPGIINPTGRVMETAQWWADFRPGTGNLEDWHPRPQIVAADCTARQLLVEARIASEVEYTDAESRGDPIGTAVWGRVPEQIRKLALLYAISANHLTPQIDADAAKWATNFIMHQTRRMLHMANIHVADSPFHSGCLKLLQKLREAPEQQLDHSVLLKRMKTDAVTFQKLITTLDQRGDLEITTHPTAGRPQRAYRIGSGDRKNR